jgi:hypothetical protein
MAKHDAEVAREKFNEATADYLATVIGDPLFTTATRFWVTESDLATETIDTIEGINGKIQGAVDTPLQSLGAALGLSSGEAAFTAGVSTNLILAPITGPLGKAETYIEVAGIVFGLLTGMHGLVLACVKPLAHSQAHQLVARGVGSLLDGPRAARPQSDTHTRGNRDLRITDDKRHATAQQSLTQPMMRRLEQQDVLRPAPFPTPQDSPESWREPTRSDPLWLCLVFVSKPPTSSDSAHTDTVRAAAKRDVTKPVVWPLGDDVLFRTLPAVLQGGSISEVDVSTARTMNNLPERRHFIVQMEGVGLGAFNAKTRSQTVYQHPGCLTGRCVPPGRPPCLCPCSVCRGLCVRLIYRADSLRNTRPSPRRCYSAATGMC